MKLLRSIFYLVLCGAVLSLSACKEYKDEGNKNSSDTSQSGNDETKAMPKFAFEKEQFDFGKIKEGEVVKHQFKFTNTGDAPLLIKDAQADCGCTVPTWPKDPIAAGGTGVIEVEYNSAGHPGTNTKTITLTANTDPFTKVLFIQVEVTPKK